MSCRGVLFALTDEESNRLIAAKGDDAVMEIVEEVEEKWDENALTETDKAWDVIHRCLSDGSTDLDGGTYPLNHCILGGRQLYEAEDYFVCLVTKQEVPDVAAALESVTEEWFRQRYFSLTSTDYPKKMIGEDDLQYSWGYFEDVREFYKKAAKANRTVIFTVDQ